MQHFNRSYTAQQSCDGDLMCYGRMRLFVHKPLIASPGQIPALQDLGHGVGVVSGVTMRNSGLFLCTTTQTTHPDFAARTSLGCICQKKRWLLSGEVNEGVWLSEKLHGSQPWLSFWWMSLAKQMQTWHCYRRCCCCRRRVFLAWQWLAWQQLSLLCVCVFGWMRGNCSDVGQKGAL